MRVCVLPMSRDQVERQKRPTREAKETYINSVWSSARAHACMCVANVERPSGEPKETYLRGKRDQLCVCYQCRETKGVKEEAHVKGAGRGS